MTQNITSSNTSSVYRTEMMIIPEDCLTFPLSNFVPWNQPEDLISYTTQQTFKEIADVYVLAPLFILSVPLNIINMVVFWKHGIRERINLCLFFLSLADVVVMVSHFEMKLDRLYATITNSPYKMVVTKFSINNKLHTLATFGYISGFMSTLIAMERCLCIISPLKAQGMFQTKTTAVVIALGHIVIFGLDFLIYSQWTVVCMYDPFTGRSHDMLYSSHFYFENKELIHIFNGIVFGILVPGYFVLGVSISTVVTVIKLHQMKEWRQQSSRTSTTGGSTTKDVALTRMLIGTNILFVVCTIPPLFIHVFILFIPELSLGGKYYNTYNLLVNVHEVCSYINSSFNFFIYYFFGTKFRTTTRHMFFRCFNSGKKMSGNLQLSTVMSDAMKLSSP